MKKILLAVAAVLALGGLGYYLSQPKCKPADAQQVEVVQMICWQLHDKTNFKEKLCQELKGTQECALYQQEDGAAVEAIIMREIAPCVNEQLAENGFCKQESK